VDMRKGMATRIPNAGDVVRFRKGVGATVACVSPGMLHSNCVVEKKRKQTTWRPSTVVSVASPRGAAGVVPPYRNDEVTAEE